jgi:quercetin dioxygenase-like cupin family protein
MGTVYREEDKVWSGAHTETGRPLHGPLQSFDLNVEAARLREEEAFRAGRRISVTLRKGEGMSVVLLVMRAGDRLREHVAPGPISMTVREARVRFSTPAGEVEAGPETLLACDADERHAVEAIEDAVCVLTIARGGRSNE